MGSAITRKDSHMTDRSQGNHPKIMAEVASGSLWQSVVSDVTFCLKWILRGSLEFRQWRVVPKQFPPSLYFTVDYCEICMFVHSCLCMRVCVWSSKVPLCTSPYMYHSCIYHFRSGRLRRTNYNTGSYKRYMTLRRILGNIKWYVVWPRITHDFPWHHVVMFVVVSSFSVWCVMMACNCCICSPASYNIRVNVRGWCWSKLLPCDIGHELLVPHDVKVLHWGK